MFICNKKKDFGFQNHSGNRLKVAGSKINTLSGFYCIFITANDYEAQDLILWILEHLSIKNEKSNNSVRTHDN